MARWRIAAQNSGGRVIARSLGNHHARAGRGAAAALAYEQARGFLLGGTSGRTTLNGEGLQHEDGHSHILAGTIPNCVSYDPTFAHEVAVILHHGLKRMVEKQENVFYYITLLNENYAMPGLSAGTEEQIIQGMYLCKPGAEGEDRDLGPLLDDAALADFQPFGRSGQGDANAATARIADQAGAVYGDRCRQHLAALGFVGRGHHHHVGDAGNVGNVKGAVVGRAVGADQAAAIDGEYDRQIL